MLYHQLYWWRSPLVLFAGKTLLRTLLEYQRESIFFVICICTWKASNTLQHSVSIVKSWIKCNAWIFIRQKFVNVSSNTNVDCRCCYNCAYSGIENSLLLHAQNNHEFKKIKTNLPEMRFEIHEQLSPNEKHFALNTTFQTMVWS